MNRISIPRKPAGLVSAGSRKLLRTFWLLLVAVSLCAALSSPEPPPLTDDELMWLACIAMSDQPGGGKYLDRVASLKLRGFSEALAKDFINHANRVMVEFREFEAALPDRSRSSVTALAQAKTEIVQRRSGALRSRLSAEESRLVGEYLEFLRSKTNRYSRDSGK